MVGGIPVKLTVAGLMPPRPWSPPGFAEAYAEAYGQAKEKDAEKPSPVDKAAEAIARLKQHYPSGLLHVFPAGETIVVVFNGSPCKTAEANIRKLAEPYTVVLASLCCPR